MAQISKTSEASVKNVIMLLSSSFGYMKKIIYNYWVNGRDLILFYEDEYGPQILFFKVIGNKRFKVKSVRERHFQLRYLKTTKGKFEDMKLGPEWRHIKSNDYVLGGNPY